ncbi:MAG: PBP1A family penicillin-binding protein, partial [Acidobacteriaceae bacterium]|nr:PBP1A family penicillin-binding protein [Acidobacteriaceae bacterium]
MAVQKKAPPTARWKRWLFHPVAKKLLAVIITLVTLCLIVIAFFYVKYSRLIEQKLAAGPFANTSMLFAAPRSLAVGDEANAAEVVVELRRAGYTESQSNRVGHYAVKPDEVDIYPGPDSYFRREDGVVKFHNNKVSRIISLADNTDRTEYTLEPELISNIFDKHREKRRLVKYEDIPPVLVHAVVAIEDKRFFQHAGFDPIRIVKAAYVDVVHRRYAQGASTLSQQLARQFWLDNDKTWRRKIPELLITLHLEQKLSKNNIFEYYANQVPLGQRGSFGIRGFGEASQVFFGKDLQRLTLAEAATLAGLIQQPSYTNPVRWPDRAKQRRNVVLKAMLDNKYISEQEYAAACAAPMQVTKHSTESTDAPYFVDLVNDSLIDKFQDYDFQAHRYHVYTTLDLQLQRDASEAVRIGMEELDKTLRSKLKKGQAFLEPQCALIALDPNTGEVKALIGGRNYGVSQLNRAMAKRQPGSSFKPFVYAAALNTGLVGGDTVLTPATMFVDEPTTFWFAGKPYEPGNFHGELMGNVSLRQAMAHSLNIPTVKAAEEIGYGSVVDMAKRAGMNLDIRPTPAVALGAYEVMPLEIAGAYTVFANHGVSSKPYFVSSINTDKGEPIFEAKAEHRQALDPRVAFLMDSLLQEVLTSGTGAGVHGRGINFPAYGKTGTSRDGWFAGFTSRILCVVWVGYDDNSKEMLEGAKSAMPVWAEFMRRAHEHRAYRNVTEYTAPPGIGTAQIDPNSGQLATSECPTVRT